MEAGNLIVREKTMSIFNREITMNILKFRIEEDNLKWDNFVKSFDNYSFLNSSFRYEHEKCSSTFVERYIISNDDTDIGFLIVSIGKTKLFGNYLECKHSPSLQLISEKAWEDVFDFCLNLANEKNCFMYRVSPLKVADEVLLNVYKKKGFFEAPIQSIDALISQYFDLKLSEEDLRHGMSDSTRNNLNKLMKNPDVSVKVFNDGSQLELFTNFYKQTELKKGFQGKSVEALTDELKRQIAVNSCYMIVGYFKEVPVSIWQCTVYGKYLHVYQAGSDTEFREKNVRMPYLLYWEAVKLGKSLNCEILDLFGGMTPEGYTGKRHPWIGVNNFKMSFGGTKVTYLHTRDYPIKKSVYMLYYIYAYIRTLLKGYTTKW